MSKAPQMSSKRGLGSGELVKILLLLGLVSVVGYLLVLRASAPDMAVETPAPTEAAASVPAETASPVETVSLGGVEYPLDTKELKLGASTDINELRDVLPQLTELETLDAEDCALTDDEKRDLLAANSSINYLWNVSVDGKTLNSSQSSIEIPSPDKAELYAACADLLFNITEVKLSGGEYSLEQAGALGRAWEGASFTGTLAFLGKSFPADSEELDFSGIRISLEETEGFDELIPLMPKLKKVIMSDCGLSDEEMDALDLSHESVRFVWTVHFKVYSVRTDTDRFCVSDLPWNDYVAWPMAERDFAPIKYCRDLEALDLGHENFSDLSFLYNMPKMKYLILSIAHNTLDLTPIASLQELYYLEVFHNELVSLEPLKECRTLRHLNIGNCSGDFSIEPLYEMTWLDRLWFPMNHLSEEESASLVAALPDTDVYLGNDDEVGGDWRKCEVYDEMHNALFAPRN